MERVVPQLFWQAFRHAAAGKTARGGGRNLSEPTNPVQLAIRDAVAYACGEPDAAAMVWGTDGCSAPNYAVSLTHLARAPSRGSRADEDVRYGSAPRVLFDAMSLHPEMVSGEGRNDLALSKAGRGDWG